MLLLPPVVDIMMICMRILNNDEPLASDICWGDARPVIIRLGSGGGRGLTGNTVARVMLCRSAT